jgi:hypothetical protein
MNLFKEPTSVFVDLLHFSSADIEMARILWAMLGTGGSPSNPNYSGGSYQDDYSSKAVWANSL